MKVGDTIKCKDPEDMVDYMYALNREGIETDFLFEKDGEKGLWLEVTKVKRKMKRELDPEQLRHWEIVAGFLLVIGFILSRL